MKLKTLLNLSILTLLPFSSNVEASNSNIQTNAQLVQYLQKKFKEKGISTSIRLEGSIEDNSNKKSIKTYKKNIETGLIKRTIIIDKTSYSYSIYIPTKKNPEIKILFFVPSETQDVKDLQEMTGFNEISEKKGFIVVYPEVLNISKTSKLKSISNTDYLEKVVNHIQEDFKNFELYLTSWADGAFNLWDIVCTKNINIKGVAIVGASFLQRHTNNKCVYNYPSLFINATSDLIMPYDGRQSYNKNENLLGMDTTIEFLNNYNQIKQSAIKTEIFNNDIDYTRVKKELYHNNGKVMLINYKIQFAGHIWPGTSKQYPIKKYGRKTGQLNATEVITNFIYKKY